MESVERVAERFSELDGYRLVDFRPVSLPVFALRIQVAILERRSIAVPLEFALRAIDLGIASWADVEGILGLGSDYGRLLRNSLELDGLVEANAEGNMALLPKGAMLLLDQHESSVSEREIPVLWDMAGQSVLSGFVEDLTSLRDADELGHTRLQPPRIRRPREDEIDLPSLTAAWRSTSRRSPGTLDEEILRVLKVVEARPRVRPAVALAYASEDRKDIRLRIAVDGRQDTFLSENVGKFGWAEQLGARVLQGQRTAERALQDRLFSEEHASRSGSTQLTLSRRLAVARLKLRVTQEAQAISDGPEKQAKAKALQEEIAQGEAQLNRVDVTELLPFEMPNLLDRVLDGAKQRVLVTTTLPIARRFSPSIEESIVKACTRGVRVQVFVADRIEASNSSGPTVRRLNELAKKLDLLKVEFLADTQRAYFEVLIDDSLLLVSNEPPLGERKDRNKFRAFAGFRVAGKRIISSYARRYLTAEQLEVTRRMIARPKSTTRSPKGQFGSGRKK